MNSAVEDYSKDHYGNLKMLQSQEKIDRVLAQVKSLDLSLENQKLWLRGRLHTSRAKGVIFLVILKLSNKKSSFV